MSHTKTLKLVWYTHAHSLRELWIHNSPPVLELHVEVIRFFFHRFQEDGMPQSTTSNQFWIVVMWCFNFSMKGCASYSMTFFPFCVYVILCSSLPETDFITILRCDDCSVNRKKNVKTYKRKTYKLNRWKDKISWKFYRNTR